MNALKQYFPELQDMLQIISIMRYSLNFPAMHHVLVELKTLYGFVTKKIRSYKPS